MNMTSFLLTLALPFTASQDHTAGASTLLVPNAFTTDAALASTWKGTWLGVFVTAENESYLRPVEVGHNSPQPNATPGDQPRFFPSLALDSEEPGHLVFLVKNLRGVEAGDLPGDSDLDSERFELLPGSLRDFHLPGASLILQAQGSASFEHAYGLRLQDYSIILRSLDNELIQTVWSRASRFAVVPHLQWAGDLDRDGHLDLLLEIPTADLKGLLYELHLSSEATPGQLLGRAGAVEGYVDGC